MDFEKLTKPQLISELEKFQQYFESTFEAIFCYEYNPPISVDLPIHKQVEMFYNGILVECNENTAKSYGYSRCSDVLGKSLPELFKAPLGSLDEFFQSFIERGYRTINSEAHEILEDGSKRYFLNNGHAEIRKGFIASPGWFILSADYSQIELRILASISEDNALIEAFKQNKDIHTETASLIFGIPESQVTTEERKKAKVVNFGIVYGMGPYGLSQRLKIGVEEASTFIASYFLTYPGVKNWINRLLALARENGYVETLLGRKRWLSGINSNNAHVREFEERAAINAPIQGSAADMIKIAMIKIQGRLQGLKSRMIMQVHDELVLEIHEEEVDEVQELVRQEMEQGIELKVPVVVDIGVGKNWDEAH